MPQWAKEEVRARLPHSNNAKLYIISFDLIVSCAKSIKFFSSCERKGHILSNSQTLCFSVLKVFSFTSSFLQAKTHYERIEIYFRSFETKIENNLQEKLE